MKSFVLRCNLYLWHSELPVNCCYFQLSNHMLKKINLFIKGTKLSKTIKVIRRTGTVLLITLIKYVQQNEEPQNKN
jgi:hypothetical protein